MKVTSARSLVVEPGGTGVVAHLGLHALCSFADRLGLGDSLSSAIPRRGERAPLHDRGKVLVQLMAMIAGGGESCADIEYLRAEETLFGTVASDSTLWRTLHEISPKTRADLKTVLGEAREQVWSRSSLTTGSDPVVLDIDASLIEIHSEGKEGTGPTYKGGFGFHPMLCFADATGEALSGMLRPGNANANTVVDHLAVTDEAIAQLPAEIALGHGVGDDPRRVKRVVLMRADSAGLVKVSTQWSERGAQGSTPYAAGDRVPHSCPRRAAVGEGYRQIDEHRTTVMSAAAPLRRRHRYRETAREAEIVGQVDEEASPGMGDDISAAGGHGQARTTRAIFHLAGALLVGGLVLW